VAQALEHLPGKHEAMGSISSTANKTQKTKTNNKKPAQNILR
jgi:hypothetical protein